MTCSVDGIGNGRTVGSLQSVASARQSDGCSARRCVVRFGGRLLLALAGVWARPVVRFRTERREKRCLRSARGAQGGGPQRLGQFAHLLAGGVRAAAQSRSRFLAGPRRCKQSDDGARDRSRQESENEAPIAACLSRHFG